MTDEREAPPGNAVLVIEDSRTQLFALRAALERAGYDVCTVESCEDALPVLAEVPPDIILCDVVLPGMSGFDFCRRVRSFENAVVGNLPRSEEHTSELQSH